MNALKLVSAAGSFKVVDGVHFTVDEDGCWCGAPLAENVWPNHASDAQERPWEVLGCTYRSFTGAALAAIKKRAKRIAEARALVGTYDVDAAGIGRGWAVADNGLGGFPSEVRVVRMPMGDEIAYRVPVAGKLPSDFEAARSRCRCVADFLNGR